MKTLYWVPVALLLAACNDVPAASHQAAEQCRAEGHAEGSDAYKSCVHRVTEAIYISWGRNIPSKGD
jgi:hypothetical protein